MDKNTTKISGEELVLTIQNDGACYELFLQACLRRLTKGQWFIAEIIVKGKVLIEKNSETDTSFPKETIEYAKNWLNMRYHEHFLREIFSNYAILAQNSLEMWDKAQNSTKNVG